MNEEKSNIILKAGTSYTIGNYFLKGISFFTIPIYARLLSPSDYGIFNIFLSYESILFMIVGLAIHSSFKNARYKFSDGMNNTNNNEYFSYVTDSMFVILINTILLTIIALLVPDSFADALGLERNMLILLVFDSFGAAVLQCYNTDASIDYKYKEFLRISYINAILNIVLSISLILTIFKNKRYFGRTVGTTLPLVLIAIYILVFFYKRAKPKNVVANLSWGISYSLPIVPHGISQVILMQFDRVMINNMVGEYEAGIYSFAYNIYLIISVTATSLDNVWGPWFYETFSSNKVSKINKVSKYYSFFMMLFTICVMLVSPELIYILGAHKYDSAVLCVIPILIGGYFSFLYTIPVTIEYYYEKTKYIAFGTTVAALINIILNYYGIKRFGYVAAAYTTMITYALYFLFHFCISRCVSNIRLFDFAPFFISSLVLGLFSVITYLFIQYAVIRWIIALLVLLFAIIFEERILGILKKRIKKQL